MQIHIITAQALSAETSALEKHQRSDPFPGPGSAKQRGLLFVGMV